MGEKKELVKNENRKTTGSCFSLLWLHVGPSPLQSHAHGEATVPLKLIFKVIVI